MRARRKEQTQLELTSPESALSDLQLMIVAGEASSDQHGAALVQALRKLVPSVQAFGMGGSRLRAAQVETVVDSETSASVMGFFELSGKLRQLVAAFRCLIVQAKKRKPDVVIFVDFPDFNLRLAKKLYALQIPMVYFISPQLWAWRKGRVRLMKKYMKKVLTIFPFEESYYHQHGVDAAYVGHPLVDSLVDNKTAPVDRTQLVSALGLRPDLPVIALLPGSRRSEVEKLLPSMLGALDRVRLGRPGCQAILPVAESLSMEFVRNLVGRNRNVVLVSGQAREIMQVADVAVVASGTATVEAALAQVPFVVVYKLSRLSYPLARFLVRGIRNFSMANLIAGEPVVVELLQNEVTPECVAREVEALLGDPDKRTALRKKLAVVRSRLAYAEKDGKTAAERAAQIVCHVVKQQRELLSS